MPIRDDPAGRTPDRVRDRPTWLLNRAHARSVAMLHAGFEAHGDGLRGYHYRLLAALEQWGPASQADLGRDTGIDRSDVTAALLELERRSLVARRVDPEHKRRNIVTITPDGLTTLRTLDGVIEQIQRDVLAPLAADEQRQLLALLTRLVRG
ncbi:MarR family winged helix-turn-helix transcriptional regulator [Cellulomonas alba]|uniref:MarR family winged helix-turn-helix transcriptional regulator n=1 Tax=Cellulomonas alba TaxID=3053467 RepID=A0ABT7SCD2_9CELL|nr:MarR family winged helix-turn-helix transcriptional regulator [Cellulomonas alba]MDM7853851.1 MarR family winged helix-turn-helix transcriptional regulator [Cellulomonas alba]